MMPTAVQIQDAPFAFKCTQVHFGFLTVTDKLSYESHTAIM